MNKKVPGFGPAPARVMIVGEAPGENEEREGMPFVGASGIELSQALREANIERRGVYLTNVVKYRPPYNEISRWLSSKKKDKSSFAHETDDRYHNDLVEEGLQELPQEILKVQPNVIIALGDTALWALTGKTGITKYRGSMLDSWPINSPKALNCHFKVIPSFHPAAILRQWSWRPFLLNDLRRACRESFSTEWTVVPDTSSFSAMQFPSHMILIKLFNILATLNHHSPRSIICDIETTAGFIDTVGIAAHKLSPIAIPFIDLTATDTHAYALREELHIRKVLREILTHPNAQVCFQNGMYDAQYFIREMGYMPNITDDTMLAQHALFPGMPKDLNTLSSLMCKHHVYWKDEGKVSNPKVDQAKRWLYNCKDLVSTFEVLEAQKPALASQGLGHVYDFLISLIEPLQTIMARGIRIDYPGIEQEAKWVELEMEIALTKLEARWGSPLNPRSPKALQEALYSKLGLKPVLGKKTGRPTADEEAIRKLTKTNPWLGLITDLILEYRQHGTYLSTFLKHPRSPDGRFHTAFNPGGPETYRFSASANAYREGCNGQNLPPRFRRFVRPDIAYELEDWDLDRADAQVVAWDSGDNGLKNIFRRGDNIHVENCRLMFPQTQAWSSEAIEASAKDSNPTLKFYTMTKSGVHAINYLVFARTLGMTLGCTTAVAQRLIDRWYEAHPAIPTWHERIEDQLQANRTITNAFGFRRVFFDRISIATVQEALAWIGQSTTAIIITKGLLNIYHQLPEIQILLQVHDSLLMQVPLDRALKLRPQIKKAMSIKVPYEDPLVIPCSGKASSENWLACKEFDV